MTLLGHLGLRFHSHPENLATDALCFLLRTYSPAEAGLRSLLSSVDVPLPAGLRYITQDGQDGGRPDLIGRDDAGADPFLLEAKFWAGLTEQQPLGYLDRLPAGGGTLLVVAPGLRLSLIWRELQQRCTSAGRGWSPGSGSNEFMIATVGHHRLCLVSWRRLLASIRASLDRAGAKQGVADVDQLDGLCARMDAEAFIPVSAEELSSGLFRRVAEFGGMIDEISAELEPLVSRKRLKSVGGNGYFGRYLWLKGIGVLLSCDVWKWQAYRHTPLWLTLFGADWKNFEPARRALAALETETPPRMFMSHSGFPTVALLVPANAERDQVIASVVEQVRALAERLPASDLGRELPPPAVEPGHA